MKSHAKNCPCAACFDVTVQRASRHLTRVAVILWAVIAALVFNLMRQIDAMPPTPLSQQTQEAE